MSELIYEVDTDKNIYEAREALEGALKQRQFGILTEVDVAKVMKEKGVDFDDQLLLLGICNPNYAKVALSINKDVAVMLPCSIVIQKKAEGSVIRLGRPSYLVNFFQSEPLASLGEEVEALLTAAIDEVAGG